MFTRSALLSVAALGAASFAAGFLVGKPSDVDAFDLDEARTRIDRALVSSDRLEQASLVVPVLATMGPEHADALAAVFESGFVSARAGLPLELFVARWARVDPERCRARIEGWPPDVRRQTWPALLRVWVRSDADSAVGVLDTIPDESVRGLARRALIEGWSAPDDPQVWSLVSQIGRLERRREFAHVVAHRRMSHFGAEALVKEFESLPNTPRMNRLREDVLPLAATLVARADLRSAIELAEAHRDEPWGAEIVREVAAVWGRRDGPAAMAWARALPEGALRDRTLVAAYRSWLRGDDGAGAAGWLTARLDDDALAPVAIAHAKALAREDPGAAVGWAANLEDPEVRRDAQIAIGNVWLRRDGAAAERWLESEGLAGEVRRPPPPAPR